MDNNLSNNIKKIIQNAIVGLVGDADKSGSISIELSVPDEPKFGHYSTNVAMRLAGAQKKKPMEVAEGLAREVMAKAPAGFFEKVEAVAPGFVNFWLSQEMIHNAFEKVAGDERYGSSGDMKGKTVMVEFTDLNPFKLFHAGHLMSNAIGESFARLFEASGAKVVRVNYQSDIGLHVAKAIWGMQHIGDENAEKIPNEADGFVAKMEFLGKAYAFGSAAYEDQLEAKETITAINEKIYSRNDAEINKLYDMGRKWSLDSFEAVYGRVGTKFDHYFFESEVAKEGMELVTAHGDIFIKSEGAIIFPGEKYGLHTRVFISSKGLPMYEAKELGLNKEKFALYPLDLSIIVTGNEITDYFRVLMKAMELILPEVAGKTRHVPHGMLRLPTGKMSSRKGNIITADALLDQIKEKLAERISEKSDLSAGERETVAEAIAVGAIKYSILKQNPGQDIIFDFDKSLSFEGDSGPYVQYTYARLQSILRKANANGGDGGKANLTLLDSEIELALMRKMFEFPEAVSRARELYAPNGVVVYIYKLAALANKFYETTPILKDENVGRRDARLALVATAARTIKAGLALLGIRALEKM